MIISKSVTERHSSYNKTLKMNGPKMLLAANVHHSVMILRLLLHQPSYVRIFFVLIIRPIDDASSHVEWLPQAHRRP